MFVSWSIGGGAGLIGFKSVLVVATLWLVGLQVSGVAMSLSLRALLMFTAAAGIWARVYVFRPQVFSLLIFAVVLTLLRAADKGRVRALWLVPAAFALWVNLHGGWIVGLATVALWAGCNLTPLRSTPGNRAALVVLCAACVTATLVNPYGPGLWAFVTETVRFERTWIADWQPLLDAGAGKIVPWAIAATFASIALVHRTPPIPASYTLLVVGLGLGSLRVSRLDAFFSLSVLMLLAPQIAAFAEGRRPGVRLKATEPVWNWMVAAFLAVVLAVATFPRAFRCVRLDGPWMPEREAGALIAGSQLQGRLLTWFDWGQYAIWHFAPALSVSFDGRRETLYSSDYIDRHTNLYFDPSTEQAFLQRLDPDYAWLARDLPLAAELERRGWTRLFAGPESVVLSQRAVPVVQQSPIQTSPCFPGP